MNETYILLEKDIEGNLFKIGQADSLDKIKIMKTNAATDREDVILTVAKVIETMEI